MKEIAMALAMGALLLGCAPKSGTPERDTSLEAERNVTAVSLGGQYVFMTSTGDGLPAEAAQLSRMLAEEIAMATACPLQATKVEVPVPRYPWLIDRYTYECRLPGGGVKGSGRIAVRTVAPHVFVADIRPDPDYRVRGASDARVSAFAIHPKPARIERVYFAEEFKKGRPFMPKDRKGVGR